MRVSLNPTNYTSLMLTFYLVLHGLLTSAKSTSTKLQATQPFLVCHPKIFTVPIWLPHIKILGRSTGAHWLCAVWDSCLHSHYHKISCLQWTINVLLTLRHDDYNGTILFLSHCSLHCILDDTTSTLQARGETSSKWNDSELRCFSFELFRSSTQ